MSVYVTLECGGCDAVSERFCIGAEFRSVSGRSYGIGGRVVDRIEDKAPDGWMPFDPYTYATYCPECWRSIEEPAEARRERGI